MYQYLAHRMRTNIIDALSEEKPSRYFTFAADCGYLAGIHYSLYQCQGISQGYHHSDDVFIHTMHTIDAAKELGYTDLSLLLAALCHDIGKPPVRTVHQNKVRFHKHEVAGEKLTRAWLLQLDFPKRIYSENSYISTLSYVLLSNGCSRQDSTTLVILRW